MGVTTLALLLWMTVVTLTVIRGQTYNNTRAIFRDKLQPDHYHTEVRPLRNQSRVIRVGVAFELVSIVELNDVSQSFSCNGFMWFFWKDELLMWNPADYGGTTIINPQPMEIWKPRVALMNTLGERDLFKDDAARVRIVYDGASHWIPGSLFPASCKLDLTNFPFDHQTCFLQMAALYYTSDELEFFTRKKSVGTMFYTINGEWELLDSKIDASSQDIKIERLPTVQITFWLRRRPTFFLLNIVVPVVLLSFLNILVFLIPVDSGERVSYGITVLLALSVFLSIVGEMLPQTADALPIIIIYLIVIFIFSVLTVIDTIVVVFVYHRTEHDDSEIKEGFNYRRKDNIITPIQQYNYGENNKKIRLSTVDCRTSARHLESSQKTVSNGSHNSRKSLPNRLEMQKKYADIISFIVFFVIWLALTMGFLLYISDKHNQAISS